MISQPNAIIFLFRVTLRCISLYLEEYSEEVIDDQLYKVSQLQLVSALVIGIFERF